MARPRGWQWVARAGVVYALVGALFSLASFCDPALGWLGALLVPDRAPLTPSVRMYAAVMGAVVLGLGVTIARVAQGVARGESGVARGLRDGLISWFVVDTVASLAHGSWQNALFNVLSLALGLPPILLVLHAKPGPRADLPPEPEKP